MSLRAATVTIHQQVLLELGWAGLIAVAHCATLLQAEHKHLPTHRYIAASCQMCRYYCEAQARVRQGSARDGSQGERP